MKKFTLNIRGDDWTFISYPELIYHRKFGDDAWGETDAERRTVYFVAEALTLKTVIHELVHVFMSYCYLQSTERMCLDDVEEVFAELISNDIDKIKRLSHTVYKRLK